MEFCFITSIPHLYQYATKSKYHLTLAHLFPLSETYTKFYLRRKALGEYIILDNSFFELGHSIDPNKLLEVTNYLKPDEVVSPETDEDISSYKKIISDFKKQLNDNNYQGNLQAVVKGNSLAGYLACYNMLSEHEDVDVIGIPVEMTKLFSRVSFLVRAVKFFKKSIKPIHFLGLKDPAELVEINSKENLKKLVRSCDSSIPFWHGVYGVEIYKHGFLYEKISKKVDFVYEIQYKKQHKIISKNIKTIKRMCK